MGRSDTVRMRADRRGARPGEWRRQRASRCPRRRAAGAAHFRQRALGESAAGDGARAPQLLRSLALAFPGLGAAADWGVNVYGLSRHLDRAKARELHVDSELNPGLGLRYRVPRDERLDWIFDTGFYRDSGRNRAFFAGAGASWHATGHLRLAGALTFFKSDTYNRGRAGIAPLPVAVWETRAVSFNLVFFPKVPETNSIATLGFWLTLWPGGW